MLRLNLKKESYWLDLPAGVRVKVRPLSTAVMIAAQTSVIKQIVDWRKEREARIEANGDASDLPDVDNDEIRHGLTESLLCKAMARASIIEWEGVMLPDKDDPAPVNNTGINDLMDIWFISQEFFKQYTASLSLLEVEGNGSGLVAAGTSAAGQNTAKAAATKASPVARVKKAS